MKIKIIYFKSKYIIEPFDDNIEYSLKKFSKIIKIDLKNLQFTYQGKPLDFKRSLKEYQTKVIILIAYFFGNITHNKKTCDILCPECNNPGILNFVGEELNIINCRSNHKNYDIQFKDFLKENKEINRIEKCDICGNTENLYGIPFESCSCKKIICPLCLLYHDPSHKSVSYYNRFSSCHIHSFPYIIYCHDCNINICSECEQDHPNHKTTYKKSYVVHNDELNKILRNAININNDCKRVQEEIKRFRRILDKVLNYYEKNIEGYSLLNEYLLEWIKDMKNYETVKNIENLNEFNKYYYSKYITPMLNASFIDKIKIIYKYYESKKDFLTIFYNNPNKLKKVGENFNNLDIFNETFVNNNKYNCWMKIRNDKPQELKPIYPYSKNKIDSALSKIKVKLIIDKKDKKLDLYRMFQGCTDLIGFDDDEFTDFGKLDKMVFLFGGCSNLTTLPDLSIIDVSENKDFSNIFSGCTSLTSLPDISNWQTNNATNMKGLFKKCQSLLNLPDISKWNTSNVKIMDEMFSGCESLISLPNISIWNTSNLKSLNEMFLGCKTLTSFPELTNWDTSNVTDMVGIFNDCNISITPNINISPKLENESVEKYINYQQVWSKIYQGEPNKNLNYNKFCEAFFIITLNKKEDNKNVSYQLPKITTLSSKYEIDLDSEQKYLFDEDRPKIIFKYPLDANKKFDLEDLAYSCFSSGIYAFIEQPPIEQKSFIFSFKNEYNEKFYLFNYFTYKKISLEKYYCEYRDKKGENSNGETETPQGTESEIGKGHAFIPVCFCLISKYFYIKQFLYCLKSIYSLYSKIDDKNNYFVLRDLILFLINSLPIPPLNKQIKFMIPCIYDSITLDCPKFKGIDLLNTNIPPSLRCFSISKNSFGLIWPLRILINEKSLIILGKDENRLTKLCDAFLSLLYPFEWIHTYIPVLNEINIKKINLSSPFLIGANFSIIDKVANLLQNSEIKEEVFLLYIYDGYTEFDIGSSLTCSSNIKFSDYFKKNVPDFPDSELYWGILRVLKEKTSSTLKSYAIETKTVNREFIKVAMKHYADYILYIEKTKEKKRKLFYANLSKTKLFNNYIKNKDKESLEYFKDFLTQYRKNKKKVNLEYDLDSVKEKFLIHPVLSTLNIKFDNILDLQKAIWEKYPEDKKNERIFENDVELKESDFTVTNDKIYLFND